MTDSLQDVVALLPCPFCGEAVTDVVVEGSTFRWRRVAGCCAEGPEVRHNTLDDDQVAAEADSRKRAIEAWNTRLSALSAPVVSDEMVERVARRLCRQDMREGASLDEAVWHLSKWRRYMDEARELLTYALGPEQPNE